MPNKWSIRRLGAWGLSWVQGWLQPMANWSGGDYLRRSVTAWRIPRWKDGQTPPTGQSECAWQRRSCKTKLGMKEDRQWQSLIGEEEERRVELEVHHTCSLRYEQVLCLGPLVHLPPWLKLLLPLKLRRITELVVTYTLSQSQVISWQVRNRTKLFTVLMWWLLGWRLLNRYIQLRQRAGWC